MKARCANSLPTPTINGAFCSCKGVVVLLEVFEDKAMVYLVFEACMGGDLYAHMMRNRGTLHEEYVVTKVGRAGILQVESVLRSHPFGSLVYSRRKRIPRTNPQPSDVAVIL